MLDHVAFTSSTFTGERCLISTGYRATIELARADAWRDVDYYANDPQVLYPEVWSRIEAVCTRCKGSGEVHRAKRMKVCASAYHKTFSAKCYVVCPSCGGNPSLEIETTR